MDRGLLERDAHDATTVPKLGGGVADKQMSEVLDRHLPLEGHASAARRVGAHALP